MLQGYTLEELERRIGYVFDNKALIKQAVTHSSFTNEQKINKLGNYERLEFLGDAVLELISSDFLYHEYPDKPEGTLTKTRAAMVCEPSLAFCARDLELGKFMLLGKGEESTGGRDRDSITSDAMEALIGAIYLDGGIGKAKEFIYRFILSDLEDKQLFFDSKTTLQELAQKELKAEICYELVSENGPEHEKEFVVEVHMDGKVLGRGYGKNKKSAQQHAAYEALLLLKNKRKK
ncbi:MAG: ribonuclease III [Lachnospiraceae bacterium]|nr:ribonuclease III [Lachnospiraceae bacterium]